MIFAGIGKYVRDDFFVLLITGYTMRRLSLMFIVSIFCV